MNISSASLKYFPEKKNSFKKLPYIFSKRSFSYVLGNVTF